MLFVFSCVLGIECRATVLKVRPVHGLLVLLHQKQTFLQINV